MKTKLFSLEIWKFILPLMLLCCIPKSNAQCSPDVLILLTQADVDNFGATYPSITDWDGSIQVGEYNGNANITNLNGLSNLITICGNLTVRNCPLLPNLSGLGNLTHLGNLFILVNPLLTNLVGLNNLNSVENLLDIEFNNMLVDLQGLGNLNSVNTLSLYNNNALIDLNGLGNVNMINTLTIWESAAITSLNGLNLQTSHLENLNLIYDPMLENVDALLTLTSAGYIEIGGNNSLNNLDGFSNLQSVVERFTLAECPNISNVDALQNLTSVGVFSLQVMNVTNLNGLINLHSADQLDFSACYQLENLSGLENLTSLKNLALDSCDLLNSIDALANVVFLEDPTYGNSLYIYSNPLLGQCSISPICDKITDPNFELYIQDNAIGCESVEAVIASCNLGVAEVSLNTIKIFPNPSSSIVNISGSDFLKVKIFDMVGRKVLDVQIENNSFNVEKLASGRYVAQLIGNGGGVIMENLIVK